MVAALQEPTSLQETSVLQVYHHFLRKLWTYNRGPTFWPHFQDIPSPQRSSTGPFILIFGRHSLLRRPCTHSITPYGFFPGQISTQSAPTAFLKAVIHSISFHGLFEAVIQHLHPTAAFPRAVIHQPQLLRPYQRRHSSPSASRLTIKPNLPSASQPPRLFKGHIFTITLSSNSTILLP